LPRYRFHIQSAGVIDSDPTDVELCSLAEAHTRAAGMMGRIVDAVGTEDSSDWWLVVKEVDQTVWEGTADLVVLVPRARRQQAREGRWVRWRRPISAE